MSSSSNKDKYRVFCEQEANLPIFMQAWWLDAVSIGGEWAVCVIEKDGKVVGAWPYYVTKRWGLAQVNMPLQTKFAGPWLVYPERLKNHSKLAWEKEVLNQLADQLPELGRFRQNFHYGFSNWMPLYWKGFSQSTYYSYRIEELADLESTRAAFNGSVKNILVKSSQQIRVSYSEDFELFKRLLRHTISKKQIDKNYPEKLLDNIEVACGKHGCRQILIAFDELGNAHSGIYLVWDNTSVYYLMTGTDPVFKNSGASTLLIWEGIKFAAKKKLIFDFEGSMIEGVEQFFRSFGATPKPYFFISKTNSKLLKSIEFFR